MFNNNRKLKTKQLGILEKDPWLKQVEKEVYDRYNRCRERLGVIERNFGSIEDFALGHHYFGINYDAARDCFIYREWAPEAHQLFLTGDFNNWQRHEFPMIRDDFGIWSIELPASEFRSRLTHGSLVKVVVQSAIGEQDRIPAYIRRVVQDENSKNFTGQVWLPEEFDWQGYEKPGKMPEELLIYEAHIGMAQEKEAIGTYREFTENILPRVIRGGYNALQLMAIQEHPYYGSFGYHVSNFFAPSSRFGTPEELKELIREAHRAGLVVILDLVHSHTVKNVLEGLNFFDGSDHQYFHPGARGEHPQWDSKLFDYGKTEVLRFLLSNIRYWMEEFRFDGFRFDGVGSMMYHHHGLEPIGVPQRYFTEGVEWDAVVYLQLANTLAHKLNPEVVTIAEDVTGMPGLTVPVDEGGIGFDFRLGMGLPDFWVETIKTKRDEEWDLGEMWNRMTDRLPWVKTVAYAESHDQALVGDKTLAFWLMDKEMYFHMSVEDDNLIIDRGMALHKMIRIYTLALGGEAWLNFMGNEFGHPEWIDFPREGNGWSFKYCRRQWSLADNRKLKYHFLADFDREMIHLAKKTHLLGGGYGRQLNLDHENKTIIFEKAGLVFLFNWHPNRSIPDYRFPVPEPGEYRIVLNSDSRLFGGHDRIDDSILYPTTGSSEQNPQLSVYNTNRTALVFRKVK
ncbi:MAG: alpha amylase C-terminal domain-containing protein [Bacteroidales bacterium]